MVARGQRTWAVEREVCPLLPTPGLAADGRGEGVGRVGGQWDSCERKGRGPVLQDQRVVAGEETQPLSVSVDEAALELLRQFDLAWQYGPCTGENAAAHPGACPVTHVSCAI